MTDHHAQTVAASTAAKASRVLMLGASLLVISAAVAFGQKTTEDAAPAPESAAETSETPAEATGESAAETTPDPAAFLRDILAAVDAGDEATELDPSAAAGVEQAVARASAALAANDADAALAALNEAAQAVRDARPFGVRKAVLIDGEVDRFGEETPRDGNAFAPGETVTLYVEPVGYAHVGEEGDYRVTLSGDYALLSPSQRILLVGQADFASFDFETETRAQDIFLTVSYTLRDLRPGAYTLVTRLNDETSDASASFRTPIEIAE